MSGSFINKSDNNGIQYKGLHYSTEVHPISINILGEETYKVFLY